MVVAIAGIIYGLSTLASIELKVLHERQPLYVIQSDGSVQNKYVLKILNKTDHDMQVALSVRGHKALQVIGADTPLAVPADRVAAYTIFLRIPGGQLSVERIPVMIKVTDTAQSGFFAEYNSMFFGPPR